MFRILTSSRSLQQRSTTILRCRRCFHLHHSLYVAAKTALNELPSSLSAEYSNEKDNVLKTGPIGLTSGPRIKKRKNAGPAGDGPVAEVRPSANKLKLKDILEKHAAKATAEKATVKPKVRVVRKTRTPKANKDPTKEPDSEDGKSAEIVDSKPDRGSEKGIRPVNGKPEKVVASKTDGKSTKRVSSVDGKRAKGVGSKAVRKPRRFANLEERRHSPSESISPDPRGNIQGYLEWLRSEAAIGDKRRMNIVSEPLIDDILERLKPSLEKHMGCDIIDINPGAALFSAKLHDHLQPRTHILLEPDKAYMPLLEPLLDPPGSKYTLLPKSGLVWGHLEKVLCNEFLPFQQLLDNNDPKLEKPNDTLLVVANLGLYPKRTYRGFPSLAVLVIHQLLSAIHAHSLFQRYGLVRMLVWLHDDETYTLLPKTLSARRKSALEAEITCESISEVVSSTAPYTMFRRFAALDIKRFSQVKERMEEAGITVPSTRESDLMQNFNEGKTGYEDTENFTADFLKELADLEASYEKGEFQETLEVSHLSTNPFNGKDLAGAKVINTPEFVRLQECRWRYQTQIRKKAKWIDLIFEYANIISLQKKIFKCKDATETENLKENLKISTKAWKDDFDELSSTSQDIALAAIYEKIAFDVEPPVLMWDRREVEPLKAHAEEFHPPRPMSLIDIQPKSVWPILRKNYPDNFDILDYIVCQLYIIPTQSMKRGLTALAPGAYEWLVAECPALTDPTKGGNLDLDFMPVRMVSMEMLEQMVEAWARWPFRPSKFELMTRLGSSVHDELDDDAQFK